MSGENEEEKKGKGTKKKGPMKAYPIYPIQRQVREVT